MNSKLVLYVKSDNTIDVVLRLYCPRIDVQIRPYIFIYNRFLKLNTLFFLTYTDELFFGFIQKIVESSIAQKKINSLKKIGNI